MNKKLFFNIVFLISGSFILISMVIIVSMNFMKDARLFQPSVAAVVEDKTAQAPKDSPREDEVKNTIRYDKEPVPIVDKKNFEEDAAKENNDKTSKDKNKIKVEVINYTGIKNLAEEVKETLEARGYEVSAGNGKSNQPISTIIIERNDKKAGEDIHKIIKAGTVTRWPDPKSRFDVTIKIGDDYMP